MKEHRITIMELNMESRIYFFRNMWDVQFRVDVNNCFYLFLKSEQDVSRNCMGLCSRKRIWYYRYRISRLCMLVCNCDSCVSDREVLLYQEVLIYQERDRLTAGFSSTKERTR